MVLGHAVGTVIASSVKAALMDPGPGVQAALEG